MKEKILWKKIAYNMEQTERDLTEQAAPWIRETSLSRGNIVATEFIESLEEQSRIKRPWLSIGVKQSLVARIARLENLKDAVRGRFVQVCAGHSAGLRWRKIDTVFESRILTGAVINFKHIEPCHRRCERNCARACTNCFDQIWQHQDKHSV